MQNPKFWINIITVNPQYIDTTYIENLAYIGNLH